MPFFPKKIRLLCVGILVLGALPILTEAYTPNKPSPRRPSTPFIHKEDMTGIWRLTHPKLSLPTTSKSSKEEGKEASTNDSSIDNSMDSSEEDEIVLRLNYDGTFDQYTPRDSSDSTTSSSPSEVYSLQGVLSRGGVWEFRDSNLILAPDRPEDTAGLGTKVHDTLLAGSLQVHVSECLPTIQKNPLAEADEIEGKMDSNDEQSSSTTSNDKKDSSPPEQPEIDVHLSIPTGHIKFGKFMYPRRHKAFFDDPMLFPDTPIGTFAMRQVLGNLNARLKREEEEEANKKPPKFDRSNFYDRRFYLTATPHAVDPHLAALDPHYDEDNVKYDVRVMPITFHSNNTFTAIGTEKILRGRFGVTGEEGEKLWFQVNMFGFGRSAPGSVYSEGRLLSHDDRRGYLGMIQEYQGGANNQTMYHIDGEFYYGTDLKRPNKAHSWGTFSLQEVALDEEDEDDDEEDESDDDDDDRSFPTFESDMSDSALRDDGDDAFQ